MLWSAGPPDAILVERVRGHDNRAFELLFERYQSPLRSFCAHMLGDRDEGEDAVQQVFISALADLRRSSKPIDFKPWVYQIARNRCLSAPPTARSARGPGAVRAGRLFGQ